MTKDEKKKTAYVEQVIQSHSISNNSRIQLLPQTFTPSLRDNTDVTFRDHRSITNHTMRRDLFKYTFTNTSTMAMF